jgi:hypothetical protein
VERFFKANDKKLLSLIGKQNFLGIDEPFALSTREDVPTYVVHRPTSEIQVFAVFRSYIFPRIIVKLGNCIHTIFRLKIRKYTRVRCRAASIMQSEI